jgi:hypothetical protein
MAQRPVYTIDDVLAIVPTFLHPDDPAPVRDGIFAGLLALCAEISDWGEYAAAQADVLRATGNYEDAIGAERENFRTGNDDTAYRSLLLSPPAVVTPAAILATVNAVLAPYTNLQAAYFEANSDRAFAYQDADPAQAPRAYAYQDTSQPQTPDYFDRLYASEAAQNVGFFCPGREPGNARVFQDDIGRYFVLRVPDLSSINAQDTPVYQELPANADDFFVGTGAAGSWTSYVLQNAVTAATLYAAVINVVLRLNGQSIRFALFVDLS